MTRIPVRQYKEGDEAGILDLLVQCLDWPRFNLDTSLQEHYRWKYFDSPSQKGAITVAEDLGKIVGCAHLSYLDLKLGDRVFRGANGTDVAVHADYRRRGIFNSLNEFRFDILKENSADIALWSTANPILVQKWRQLGQLFPFDIVNYAKIFDFTRHLSDFPMQFGSAMKIGFQTLNKLNTLSNRSGASSEDIEIANVKEFRETDIWEKMSAEYDYMVARDNEYMNWRYSDPRSGQFIKIIARRDGECVGYAVLGINYILVDYPFGYIVDIFCIDDVVYDELISYSLKYFEALDVNLVNCLAVKGSGLTKILNRNGFLNSRIKFHLAYNIFNSDFSFNGLTPNKTYFCFGDRDSLPTQASRN